MKVLLTVLTLMFLSTTPVSALEACNRYDDNVDECYENYYRNASNYDYRRHKNCMTVDRYGQCAGGAEKSVKGLDLRVMPEVRCRYDHYYDELICDDLSIRVSR